MEDAPRSKLSEQKAYVRFLNLTNQTVEIVWINFTGQYVRYHLLRHECYIDIDTYLTHPWMALNVHTKDRMLMDKQLVFLPKTYLQYVNENPNIIHPILQPERRKLILITLPLHSLRYRSLLAVRDFLRNTEDADELDLPKPLLDDLKRVIELRSKYLTTPIYTMLLGVI